MATNANLPAGAFITSLAGKRCTAIPKANPAAAQPTTAFFNLNSTSSASPVLPTTTESLRETVLPPPPQEAPSATSSIPPPVPPPVGNADNADVLDSRPTLDAGATPTQLTTSTESIVNLDIPPEETALSEPSPSESSVPAEAPADDSIASTSTANGPAAPTTESSLDSITTDPAIQETPTAGGNAAVSMEIPPTSTSATVSSLVQDNPGVASPSSTVEAARVTEASSNNTRMTVAVAGGVVGGLALLSLAAFLIFFLRRRSKRRRRSTMLTSMFGDPNYRRREKQGAYTIDRTSLGPTPVSEKVKGSIVSGYKRARGRFSNIVHSRSDSPRPTVDLDRGTSQFGPPLSAASSLPSRSSSRADYDDADPTLKERFFGWWGRLGRSGPPKSSRADNDPFAAAGRSIRRVSRERVDPPKNAQPDFLTLLKMDEEAAVATAAQETGPGSRNGADGNQKRRSTIAGQEHFLGGLGLDFESAIGNSPFSDANAIKHDSSDAGSSVRHDSATIPPLALAKGDNADNANNSNPFSDSHAITGGAGGPPMLPLSNSNNGGGPATYVQDLRRSRGRSINTNNVATMATTKRMTRDSNTNYPFNNNNRTSGMSDDSVDMYRRNTKFRSDPFDLDRPELFSSSSSSLAASRGRPGSRTSGGSVTAGPGIARGNSQRSGRFTGGVGVGVIPPRAVRTHTRAESYTSWTSRYSGYSEGDSDGNGNANANANANVNVNANGNGNGNGNGNRGRGRDTGILDGWSDPGPDVGPSAAAAGDKKGPSQGSVGMAL